jgi:hypothetical protein
MVRVRGGFFALSVQLRPLRYNSRRLGLTSLPYFPGRLHVRFLRQRGWPSEIQCSEGGPLD